jgi:dihydropteroate synthase
VPIILKNYIRENERGEKIFDFEQIVPVGDVPDWYDQRREKWGTKWVGYDLYIDDAMIEFYTAWSPPIPIIKKLAELHKDFVFKLEYYEEGVAFRGAATARWQGNEVLLENNCWYMTDKDF